jgi:hypothetical protein
MVQTSVAEPKPGPQEHYRYHFTMIRTVTVIFLKVLIPALVPVMALVLGKKGLKYGFIHKF